MKNILATFLFFLIFSNQTVFSHEHHSVVPDEFQDEKNLVVGVSYFDYDLVMLNLISKDLDITGVDLKIGHIDVLLSDSEYEELLYEGYDLFIKEEKKMFMRPDQEYKNPEEIASFLEEMSDRYPEISKLVSIGNSLEGRSIWAIKISDNPELDEVEPAILINSMHHAREVMTPEIGIDMVEYLLTRYNSDERVKNWVDSNEIWIVPMLNVDGNNKVWSGSSMWRKNTRGGYGVDINRNYPFKWGACNGSSGSSWSQTYRGVSAGSEPETQALMGLVANVKPVFDISYHSYSELVLYPYGCRGEKTETHEIVSKIGNKIGEILDYTAGTPWEILYGVDGGDVDWMYAVHQVIPYVIELNSSREGFQPSYSQWRDVTVERNRPAWIYLLDRLEGNGVRGIVKDSNGEVISDYVIDVEKITDKGRSLVQTYRANPDGSYHLILNAGNYELKFKRGSRSVSVQSAELTGTRLEINPILN